MFSLRSLRDLLRIAYEEATLPTKPPRGSRDRRRYGKQRIRERRLHR